MKKLSTYLFLILFSLSAPSFADDIRDFEIEGMSIGDSLLDYFSEEEITNKKKILKEAEIKRNEEFAYLEIFDLLEAYDKVRAMFKTKDKKYKIYKLHGIIWYENNINDCYKKKNTIVSQLTEIFKSVPRQDIKDKKIVWDESGKSKRSSVDFNFISGDYASISCYDWSKEMKYADHLRVSFITKEYKNWIIELSSNP
jgi:hypothetical protein